jgi:hypothetical protein
MLNNRTLISFLLLLALVAPVAPVRAEEPSNDYFKKGAPGKGVLDEAATSIFGRVFGFSKAESEIDYHVVELYRPSPAAAAVRSALIPGWGQSYNKQQVKGALFFLSFAAATYGSISLYQKSNNSYHSYIQNGQKDDPRYDDYSSERTQAYMLGGTAALLWGVSMIDAYIHGYAPLWSDNSAVQIALVPGEGSVVWRKRF